MKDSQTKVKIIQAGEEIFSLKGYDATSVQDICDKAGVSKGAFFHYFPSKEIFFMEILDIWLSDLSKKLQNYILSSKNLYKDLVKMSEIFKEIFKDSHQKFYLFIEFLRFGVKDEKIAKKIEYNFDLYTNYFTDIIKKGIENGIFKDVDPNLISHILVSYAIGTIEQEILNPKLDWDIISREGVKFILGAIKRRNR